MRAAISPSERCASTRRSSSSYSRALPSTMAAWLASAPRSSASSAANASGRDEYALIAPSGPDSPIRGALICE